MAFYESTFIARQDISNQELEKIIDSFVNVAENNGGKLIRKENWGLRNLAYRVKKNRKGHYVMLALEANAAAINELQRHYKLHEDVIRYITIKVDAIAQKPSALSDKKAS